MITQAKSIKGSVGDSYTIIYGNSGENGPMSWRRYPNVPEGNRKGWWAHWEGSVGIREHPVGVGEGTIYINLILDDLQVEICWVK